eukprot:CAMPEP_0119283830 /NCGR_PEP_ID=MMETSP1329-20130426/29242_1 /TAXON_ID=114041 /ORGANISM="Genus nov. species nov., Strain RCC1024" /LENGTH=326 /DNA_ID=CAMNT_0007284505 /DNA_START=67 /DNA_END=1044 /DNA_ORIENTATION=+
MVSFALHSLARSFSPVAAGTALFSSSGLSSTSTAAACQATADASSPLRHRVTPVKDLEQNVIVLERQVAGEPLRRVTLQNLVDDLAAPARRLLLFGEHHDDARAQEVERTVFAGVQKAKSTALALEFVDTDAREAASSFATGASDDVDSLFRGAGDTARYGPLARLAREFSRPIVAANAPRRLAQRVAKQGPASLGELSPEDLDRLPPLPSWSAEPLSAGYAERLRRVGLGANYVAAQCLWDASMAWSCLSQLAQSDAVMLVCGAFHVQYFLGVVDHVEKYTAAGGPFAPLDRDEFRVVVCAPLAAHKFDDVFHRDVCWDDPALDT